MPNDKCTSGGSIRRPPQFASHPGLETWNGGSKKEEKQTASSFSKVRQKRLLARIRLPILPSFRFESLIR
jgi:hypothetical protein